MAEKKERHLGCELLRMTAMIMIVCLHYLSKGGLLGSPSRADMTATGYTIWFVEALCLVAVNAYVLLSGYFGANAAPKDVIKRGIRIWRQVFFYSMVIGLTAMIAGVQQFDLYQFFSYCFPIVTEHYWFATSYLILCLFMPFLNAGIAHLGKKDIQLLTAGLLVLFCISKTVIPMQLPWDKYGYDGFWFVVLYLTGAYLGKYEMKWVQARWHAVLLYLGSVTAIFASFFILRMVFLKTGKLENMISYGYTYNFLACYTGAVGLFLAFAKSKAEGVLERFRRPIEQISGASFGVYLIHEHMNLRAVWPAWFHCKEQIDNSVGGLLLHMICTVFVVYVVCTLIEMTRKKVSSTIFGERKRGSKSI